MEVFNMHRATAQAANAPSNDTKHTTTEETALNKTTTYEVAGRQFVVEPVFDEASTDTIGTILLKLIAEKG
jgi:hypothetical protein